ncbi:hypothetical protein FRC00_004168 [Tulasnella sp. 408]|nr:hypothetical protein FRC00_004168 [Tulasnella sp. 408]
MENELGGVGGISRLCQAVYNLWASAQSRWGRDYVRQFFLLVKLYESCSQIRTLTVQQKVQRWTDEAEQLVQRMEEIRSKRTKEEAQQLAELICKQMMGIIDDLGLDPAEDNSVGTRWKKAKKDSKALDEAMKRLPSVSECNIATSIRNAQAATSILTLKEERIGANIPPLTIQAMDTVYLRYVQSSDDPAIWGPVDPCSPVTLSQFHKKRSQAERNRIFYS